MCPPKTTPTSFLPLRRLPIAMHMHVLTPIPSPATPTTLAKTKPVFTKLFSTNIPKPEPKTTLISHYFSLLHSSPNFTYLRHLHAHFLRRKPLYSNILLTSRLILSYSRHNTLKTYSLNLFNHIPNKNIYSWNIIIGEFSRSDFPEKCLLLFRQMWKNSTFKPDSFTLPLVLKACVGCGAREEGILVHGLCLKLGFERNLHVGSGLVSMYVGFGEVSSARKLFDEMPDRDLVMWTSMLSGYAQSGKPILGLGLFREMMGYGLELDWVVMVSLFFIFSHLGWLKHGRSVHGWCVRRCLEMGLNLGNAAVDMYVKCSDLTYARRLFDRMNERDVISWSTLILGYGYNGDVDRAFYLFTQMREKGVEPNDVTFLGVLSACAHGGLVDKARMYFDMMGNFGVVSRMKHYACMVDCLGRAGLLVEAENFIEGMPVKPDGSVLGALLGSCRVHGNLEMGERVAKLLVGLEPQRPGYHLLLAGIYAAAGRFNDAERVRDLMKNTNVVRIPGYSLVEAKC